MNYERGKEDHINLSHSLRNSLKVSIDHETLKLSQDRSSTRLSDEGVSDDQFLDLQRRRAETLLIKSKIVYKLHQDKQLSTAESNYLYQWMDQS